MDDRGFPKVREIDLRECKVSSTVDGVNVMRGIKSSAAFFTFLRANLALSSSSLIASPSSTPQLDPFSAPSNANAANSTAPSLAPTAATSSKPASRATPDLVPLDDIPNLSLDPLKTEEEQEEGLQLLAETVAGMRGPAAISVISHPACIVPLTALLSLIYYSRYAIPGHFRVTACCTYGAVVLYCLVVWWLTRGYKTFAADTNRAWLDEEGPNRDIVIGARNDDNSLAGIVVLRLIPKCVPTGGGRRRSSLKGGRCLIRAWAVRRKDRGRGVGRELLQAAVRVAKERCGKDAELGFVQDHAHSRLLFHSMFNGFFRKVEVAADKTLRKAVDELALSKKKRR